MSVARLSGRTASVARVTASASESSSARPRPARSSKVMTQSSPRVERSTPVVSMSTTFSTAGIEPRWSLSLRELLAVLGDRRSASRSREDERDVLGVGARVDRGGGSAGGHRGQVEEDPLEAGVARDRDAVLGLQAQREQARGELGDALAAAAPAPGLPAAAGGRGAEGLAGGVGCDAVEEQPSERRRRLGHRLGAGARAAGARGEGLGGLGHSGVPPVGRRGLPGEGLPSAWRVVAPLCRADRRRGQTLLPAS